MIVAIPGMKISRPLVILMKRKLSAFKMYLKGYIFWFFLLSVFSFFIMQFYFYNKQISQARKTLLNFSSILSNGSKTQTTEECKTKKKKDGIWTVNSIGRFGNQMGQYATLYALAKLNGHEAYIQQVTHNWLAPVFKISLPVLHDSVFVKMSWKIYKLFNKMLTKYNHIEGKYVKLAGYPCSWTFYHHIREEILQEFTFHDFIRDEANKYLEEVKGSRRNATFIGVHVRRGDYVKVMTNTWKGVVADKAYLEKAMGYFRRKYQEPLFVVTSDGMKWCKKNIDTSRGDVYFSGDGVESSPGRDFALLAHCNHTIMTIGTFGFWASYLARGETIYLTNFTLPNSPFLKVFRYDATFLPEWIGIPADLSPLSLNW
ncbi:galactoside 2-alpha-L-fucosyltransferase 2-like [Rhinatrema bivittatum]|uniref:galactoside 2-alpha-L-fucosyltransferase 2-like n=1 Tax=Rhinatrema bivittatum TaxID=194408 RepID=UPI0011292969|nr:galactoside 2-alpha-L-fucosyltransferase 2-like [Rhinatrema bivittatum]